MDSRLKLLWIARTCPYPPDDGEKIRVLHLLREAARRHAVTVVYREMGEADRDSGAILGNWGIEAVAVRVPRPTGHLERLRWVLPFVFSRYPVSLATAYFRPVREALGELGRTRRFDIVQVEHSSLTIYLDKVRFEGRPRRVLTLHNIDYLRNERVLANTPFGLNWLYQKWNAMRFKRYELESLGRYDRVVTMSEVDARLLREDVPHPIADVVPNGVDCATLSYAGEAASAPHLVFVASMDSDANHDGAVYFLREVLPRVREAVPQVRLAIVGRRPRAELRAYADGERVVVTGTVADVEPWYRQAAAAIVPLRCGGGTRLKILEAMALGVPVVSTALGAEGIEARDGEDILLADDAGTFAAAVVRLLRDPALARSLRERARQLVERRYDWPRLGELQEAVYRRAVREHEQEQERG